MSDEEDESKEVIHQNVFEQNAMKNVGTQTVPLRLAGQVVGTAEVVIDEEGMRVVSTHITDETLKQTMDALGAEASHISLGTKKETDKDG